MPPRRAAVTTTASKIFPVQGPYSFGGPDARFGVGRPGHTHQGQDIAAAEGTPVVTPIAGTVHWTAYQAGGAGYYVVIAGADGRHYVFMHLQAGLDRRHQGRAGHRRAAGRPRRQHRRRTGPHLHFEIWVNGWWATQGRRRRSTRSPSYRRGLRSIARHQRPRSRPSTAAR